MSPDAGQLTEDLVAHTGPTVEPLYPPPPWTLPGARVLKVMFETDKEPVLSMLPPKLTRSSPPYAIIEVAHYPETPAGPFTMATQFIGCRASFFMRAYALHSVVDNPIAMAALREVWGYPCRPGEITLDEAPGSVQATVRADGRNLATAGISATEGIETDTARFDPTLTLRLAPSVQENVRHDLIQIMQLDPEHTIREAARGRGSVEYPDAASAWAVLPNRNIISATWCTVDTELPLARFVLPY
jgi:acetoacetate decarboxylase